MPTITLSVPENIKKDMEESREINWSEVARAAIKEKMIQIKLFEKIISKSKLTEKSAEKIAKEIKRSLHKKYKDKYTESYEINN